MCGISAIINRKGSSIEPERLRVMNDLIAHRGPDDEGFFIDQNVGLGHRRLAIIDLSDSGHQPFKSGDLTLVYNGEIYNYIELREELKTLGYKFFTETDTEVLINSYKAWGKACTHRFNGIWAFVIYDRRKESVFASRDRFGVKPLYYYLDKDELLLSSEVKQIQALKRQEVNKAVLADFIVGGLLNHSSETFFNNIYEVPEGHYLAYDKDTDELDVVNYYELEDKTATDPSLDYEMACRQFEELFTSAVRLRLRSDVKIGLSLSGGLDSTSIAFVISSVDGFSSYSVIFEDEEISEKKYVDAVVKKYRLTSTSISPSFEEILDAFSDVVWYMDQPISTTSIVADYLLMKSQKEDNVKVTLSGQGADEILAGYMSFYAVKMIEDIKNFRLLSGVSSAFQFVRSGKSFARKKLDFAKIDWLDSSIKSSHTKDYSISSVYDLSLRYLVKDGLRTLLHYLDRNAMASSIEGRVPFLDYRLVEFCLNLPSDYKIKDGVTKRILRDSIGKNWPNEIKIRKGKLGYDTPELRWCNENFSQLKNYVLESNQAKWINKDLFQGLDCLKTDDEAMLLIRTISAIKWLNRNKLDYE